MLQELRVENLLLIEKAELRFGAGLNVLTGETGAGKTVLTHALDLLLGGRARTGIVRPGAAEAYVEGVFDLPAEMPGDLRERLSPDAGEIVLARRVGADGRTRAYLNGRSANVADLRDLGGLLLSFYGQHEHRRLTLSAAQLQILDGICGPEQSRLLGEAAAAHETVLGLRRRLGELGELAESRERELGLLEHELREIDALEPDPGEHERLLGARERLRRADALQAAAGGAAEAIVPEGEGPGAAQLLALASAGMDSLEGVDPRLDGLAERLRSLALEAQELGGELRGYCEQALDALGDPDVPGLEPTLEGVEARLAAYERLMRKHGGSIEAVVRYGQLARARHDELQGAESALEQAEHELELAQRAQDAIVSGLRAARQEAAGGFAEAVGEQLESLAMGDADFRVLLGETRPGPNGADTVEFTIAPNPGVPAGPLREIASGGELSRVMLAIMSAANRAAPQTTLVFDEVDAGVGGRTANAVGARLRDLGERGQVICITHLPQIASLGTRHFSVVKDTDAEPTRATVVQLGETDVVSELVRMLGASSDDTAARRHARDLRKAA